MNKEFEEWEKETRVKRRGNTPLMDMYRTWNHQQSKIQSLTKRIEILEHDNKKLVEMGRFYGDKDNWEVLSDYKGLINVANIGDHEGLSDRGERARETMKELKGEY